jgi:hypothetical protein
LIDIGMLPCQIFQDHVPSHREPLVGRNRAPERTVEGVLAFVQRPHFQTRGSAAFLRRHERQCSIRARAAGNSSCRGRQSGSV